jgi:hypothetical protein
MRKIDLAGRVFGQLTVIKLLSRGNGCSRWLCRCNCGNEKAVRGGNLTSGHVSSCGCWKIGTTGNITYSSWASMRSRCNSPTNPNYPRYGGRGIKICKRWDSFLLFVEDMGERPSTEYSIDRIDNDGHYCPSNCKWSTVKEQRNNQREGGRGKLIEFNGERFCMRKWAEKIGLSEGTLANRIRIGWSIERALTERLWLGRSYAGKISQKSRRATHFNPN